MTLQNVPIPVDGQPLADIINRNFALWFDDVEAVNAVSADISAGTILRTREEGWSYEVAASDATDHHWTTGSGKKLYARSTGYLTPGMVRCRTWAESVAASSEAADAAANKTKIQTLIQYAFERRIPFIFDGIYICAPEMTFDWSSANALRCFFKIMGIFGGGLVFYSTTSFTHGIRFVGASGGAINVSNFSIRDMLISQGLGDVNRRQRKGDGLLLDGMFHVDVRDCVIENFDGHGLRGRGIWDSRFESCYVQHCGDTRGTKASVAFYDWEVGAGKYNTNSGRMENFQIENSYWHNIEIGGTLTGFSNGGGAQHWRLVGNKSHRRPVGLGGVVVDGAGQTGGTLNVKTLNIEPQVGDEIAIGGVTGTYEVTAYIYDPSGDGTATLTITPNLASSPANGIFVNWVGLERVNVRVFGEDTANNIFVAEQMQPLERTGLLIEDGASLCTVVGCQFGDGVQQRQPIFIASDAGSGHAFVGNGFEGTQTTYYIDNQSSFPIEARGNTLGNVAHTQIKLSQDVKADGLPSTSSTPRFNIDTRAAASAQTHTLIEMRNAAGDAVAALRHTYSGDTDTSKIALAALHSGNFQDLLWIDRAADLFRIKAKTINMDGTARIIAGTGAPNGSVAAPVGSLYLQLNGTAGAVLFVKESGTGTAGWESK